MDFYQDKEGQQKGRMKYCREDMNVPLPAWGSYDLTQRNPKRSEAFGFNIGFLGGRLIAEASRDS